MLSSMTTMSIGTFGIGLNYCFVFFCCTPGESLGFCFWRKGGSHPRANSGGVYMKMVIFVSETRNKGYEKREENLQHQC